MRSAQEVWQAALGELQLQVNKPNYQTWFEGARGVAYQGDQFTIGVANTFIAEYLDKNQRSLIEKTLIGLTHRNIKVQFRVNATQQDPPTGYAGHEASTTGPVFNSKYTFDSFIVGGCNRLAHAAALGVAQNPEHSYNPLFIYGSSGLGKTHLLQAIGHVALANNAQVLYVSGEQFTNDFINAIRQHSTDEFRNKYRSVDMLMVDDIHFISGKGQTEESFFHTFNELHNSNRQIVITSDRPPKALPLLEDRLCSRFEWGLIVDIQPPDFETCRAILQAKAERSGVDIPPDVVEFIAQRIKKNIRELEGSLNRVIAYARLLKAKITAELAAKALKDISSKAFDSHATPAIVLDAVANSFQLTVEDLTGRRRERGIVQARQVAMYLLKQQNGNSLAEIGIALGGRQPSTVSYAYGKIAIDFQASPLLRRRIQDIRKSMYPALKGKKPHLTSR